MKKILFISIMLILFSVNIVLANNNSIILKNVDFKGTSLSVRGSIDSIDDEVDITVMIVEIKEGEFDFNSMEYIDQIENCVEKNGDFQFSINVNLNKDKTYAVRVGGTNIESPDYMIIDNNTEILYGDVDFNGIVTANDAAMVLGYSLNNDVIYANEQFLKAADVNGTGIIDASAASAILAHVLNLDYKFKAMINS